VASWTLNDGGGTIAHGPVPATLGGGASWTTSGRVGAALHLDGSTGYAATSVPAVDTSKAFSVSAWVRVSSQPARHMTAVAQSGTNGSIFYLGYRQDSGSVNRWALALQTADTQYSWVQLYSDDAHPVITGAWTHLVGLYDPATRTVRLYVNGQKVAEGSDTSLWNATGPLQIGRAQWSGTQTDYWAGDVDDVKVYDRVLSDLPYDSAYGDADAETYHLATRPVRAEGWWALDEGVGNTAADSSGNGRTATGTGTPGWITSGVFGNAISLNGTSQWLATSAGVLRTDGSFSVAAWVRLDAALLGGTLPARSMTAVGQDGTDRTPFYLGARTFSETQPDGTSKVVLRWSFSLSPRDGTGSSFSWQHTSGAIPLDTSLLDQWVLLVGVYDATAHSTRLYVPGTGDYGMVQLPSGWPGWQANGGLSIGRGKYAGVASEFWPGQIDQVRVYTGVLSATEAANLFQDNPPAVQS
jgi:hypothetical protein